MRIVIAPDSFKECLSAERVARAMAMGALRTCPEADIDLAPMADGGEGTVDALVAATGGRLVSMDVTGPLGERVRAQYGVLGDDSTAVIEMAAAAGLALVPLERRDPRVTTTRGVGELIAHALDNGLRRIIVGIGGSATNDGGAGMAQALGFRMVGPISESDRKEFPTGAAALAVLTAIDSSRKHRALDEAEILVACDVQNPLCGPNGASRVYGPQKGATPEAVDELDAALLHFARVVEAQLGVPILDVPGGGAAGGLGAGLVAFAGARLTPGVELVAQACGLEDRVKIADLVLTGEGRIDGQTVNGKTPVGVARIAKRHGVPVVALAGSLGEGYKGVYDCGMDAVFSICPGPLSLDEAVARAEELLADAAEAVVRMWARCGDR